MTHDSVLAFEQLREHVESLGADVDVDTVDLSRELAIDCPDCGRQVAFRGKCPKCAGTSWSAAGKLIEQKPSTPPESAPQASPDVERTGEAREPGDSGGQ